MEIKFELTPASSALFEAIIALTGLDNFLLSAEYIAEGDDECEINELETKIKRQGFYLSNRKLFLAWVQEQADLSGEVVTNWLCKLDYPRVGHNIDKAVLTSIVILNRANPCYSAVTDAVVREFLLYISKVISNQKTLKSH